MTSQDLEHVKRFGRWASSAFHNYLWESHGRQKDLAKGMAEANGQLLPPRQLCATEGRKVGAEERSEKEVEFHPNAERSRLKPEGNAQTAGDLRRAQARAALQEIYSDGGNYTGGRQSDVKCEHYGMDGEIYYTKHQQNKQQQGFVSPPNFYGQRGSKDHSLDPFRHPKSACVWYQVETKKHNFCPASALRHRCCIDTEVFMWIHSA